MKSIKTLLLGATIAAGFGIALGTTTDASADSLYTVKAGDTLSSISHQFKGDNSLIEQIAADNNIDNINLIFEGEQLNIRSIDSYIETAAAPVAATPVVEAAPVETVVEEVAAPAVTETYAATSSSAKEWIAQRESGGSYTATNGRYIGRYQLDSSYLNGDYSAENQERVADSYVAGRYGSWEAAQAFWLANGWY